nr:RNA-dependent RNA polymerase-associated factor 2 [Tetrahymena thermophila]
MEHMLEKPLIKRQYSVYKVYEMNQSYSQNSDNNFCICMLNEQSKAKILFLLSIAETKQFQVLSYRNQNVENEKLSQITDIVKINDDTVVCSHYDGSLVIYKNFKERKFKYNEEEYKEIIPAQVKDISDINNAILFISVFKKQNQLIIMLEYYDGQVMELHSSLSNIQFVHKQVRREKQNFTHRKFLKEEQVLCGFIDQSKFGIIEASQDIQLKLLEMKTYDMDEDTKQLLKMSTLKLITFDTHQHNQILYIVCIYENYDRQQILCSFKLDRTNCQPQNEITLNLITSFTLNVDLGEAVQIISINQNQRRCFQYDVIVLFQHKLMAYSWQNEIDEALIIKDNDEEYKIYHFQVIEDMPYHLLISQIEDKQRIQYFCTYI